LDDWDSQSIIAIAQLTIEYIMSVDGMR